MLSETKFNIADHYGLECQMHQLIEEMAELTQAFSKHFRCNGLGQPIPDYKRTTVEQNLIEELADVKLLLEQVIYLLDADEQVRNVINQKIKRTLERIKQYESN